MLSTQMLLFMEGFPSRVQRPDAGVVPSARKDLLQLSRLGLLMYIVLKAYSGQSHVLTGASLSRAAAQDHAGSFIPARGVSITSCCRSSAACMQAGYSADPLCLVVKNLSAYMKRSTCLFCCCSAFTAAVQTCNLSFLYPGAAAREVSIARVELSALSMSLNALPPFQ